MYRYVEQARHTAYVDTCLKEYLKRCTKPEIHQLLRTNGKLFGSGTWTKAHLTSSAQPFLVDNPANLYRIDSHSRDSLVRRETYSESIPMVVQERVDKRCVHHQEIREANFWESVPSLPMYEQFENSEYMALPTESKMRECLQMFIDATGNNALKKVACLSCGGRFFAHLCKPGFVALDKIPNWHFLQPETEHPSHVYSSGLLLKQSALSVSEQGTPQGTICLKCYNSLSNKA